MTSRNHALASDGRLSQAAVCAQFIGCSHREQGILMRQPKLDEIVDRYEAALVETSWRSMDVAQFLPSPSSPEYWQTLVELLRIRMEHAFADRQPIGVAECVSQFPALLNQTPRLSELAYEEFRLRQNAGQAVSPDEFREKWQVDVSSWHSSSGSERKSTAASGTKACMISLSAGEQFGPFRILCLLGKGALSKVYLAQQIDLSERAVVLKVCAQATLEPQKIALLQHPNIVQIFSVHEISGYQVLCMPYAGATTLADLLTKFEQESSQDPANPPTQSRSSQQLVTTLSNRQREVQTLVDHSQQQTNAQRPVQLNHGLTWPTRWQAMRYEAVFCELLLQLAQGLAHAHRFGIVHSDLKPANVLIGDDGQARLVDFNVAQQSDNSRQSLMGGTLPYMAPEHLESLIQDRWHAGPPSDLYSLGVIAFQLLSGRLPFRTPKGSMATMLRSSLEARQSKRFVQQLNGRDASNDMRSIVEKLLEPSVDLRYQSADDLVEDLGRHLAHRPLKYATNRSLIQRMTKWTVRHPRLSSVTSIASLAAVCVVGLVAGLMYYRHEYRTQLANTLVSQFQAELPAAMVLAASSTQFDNLTHATSDAIEQVLDTVHDHSTNRLREEFEYLNDSQRSLVTHGLQVLSTTLDAASAQAISPPNSPVFVTLKQTTESLSSRISFPSQVTLAVDRDFADLRAATDSFLKGDRTLALEKLLPLVEHAPQHHAAWLLMAACYQASGQTELADAAYASCLALMPKHWQAWYFRGILAQTSAMASLRPEQFRSADAYYSQALKLRSDLDEARFNRALCRERLGQLDTALSDATDLINRSKLLVRAHLLSARIHKAQGKAELAAADISAALACQPQSASDYAYVAKERMQADPEQASQDLQRAYELDATDPEVLQSLAYLQMEIKQDKSARLWLDRWIQANPDSALPIASRAVFFARHGDMKEAMADCQKALTLSPKPREKVQIASTLVMMAEKSTQPEEIKSLHRQALELLADAVQLDWRLVGEIARDADMRSLHSNPKFMLIVKTASTLGQLPKLIEKME